MYVSFIAVVYELKKKSIRGVISEGTADNGDNDAIEKVDRSYEVTETKHTAGHIAVGEGGV